MFFHKAEKRKPLLHKNTINEDSYILYKGGIVSSALIDIEIDMKNHAYIKSKMIIDPNDKLEVLELRICEIIEKFPKLSGLTGLQAKNLCIKSEKGLLPILSDEIMGNSIRSKDIIIFELEFSEIWLEVEMTLQSEDKNLKISFELKVAVDFFISHMKDILIKMGIKSWTKYILNNGDATEHYDYYLFSKFILIFSDKEGNVREGEIELDNFNEKIKDRFNFESNIKCRLEFLNLNQIIYKEIVKISKDKANSIKGKSKKPLIDLCFLNNDEKNRKKVVNKLINEYMEKFCLDELRNSKFAYHKNVIWKWNDEHENDNKQRLSSILQTFSCDSRRESIVEETFVYPHIWPSPKTHDRYHDSMSLSLSLYTHKHATIVPMPIVPIHSFRTINKFDTRYDQDLISLRNLDYFKLIQNHSGSFFSNREFKHLDLPDTKNFKQLSRANSFGILGLNQNSNGSRVNSVSFEDFNRNFKSNYRYLKKKLPVFIFVIIFILIAVFILNSN